MGLLDKARAINVQSKATKTDVTPTKKPEAKGLLDKAKAAKEEKVRIYTAGKIIETDFDTLYKMILERGRVKISDVADMFRIDKKMAEDWMQILEDHDLAKIHYPAMGEPEIRKIEDAKKES